MSDGRAGGPPRSSGPTGRPDDELNGPEEQTAPEGPDVPPQPVAAAPTAVTAAPTSTTPAVRGMKRRLVLALVLVVAGAAAVAGVVFLSGDYQQERELEEEVESVLAQLRDGKADEVYEQASSRFQQTLLVDRFVDLVARMNSTLGRFERAVDVIDSGRAVGVAGMTAWVLVELEFEKGTTLGQLSFHRGEDGKDWLLLGFYVVIPVDLRDEADALAAQEQRLGAPDEVIQLVHSILKGVREGRAAEVYESASSAFKGSVTVEGFTALLQSHQAELGSFVRVLGVVSSAMSPERYQARVQALLEYERAKTTGTFQFIRVDGSWRLLGFKIVTPFGNALSPEKPL